MSYYSAYVKACLRNTFSLNISDSVAQSAKATAPCQDMSPVVPFIIRSLFSSIRVTGQPKINYYTALL